MSLPSESSIQSPASCLGAIVPICLQYEGLLWKVKSPSSWDALLGVSLDSKRAQAVGYAIEVEMTDVFVSESVLPDTASEDSNAMDVEVAVDLPEGKYWIRVCGEVQLGSNGGAVFTGQAQQITRYKQREETLNAMLAEQKRENALKINFVNYAVHEFKAPLSTIFSSLDLLNYHASRYEEENGELPFFSEHFRRIAKHLQLMNAFLDEMVLLSGGGKGCKQEEFLLVAYIREFVQRLELPSMKSRQLSLHFPESDRQVRMDRLLLEHVLRNLIGNAFKYSPGERDPELELRFQEQSSLLLVRDFGLGIPEEEQRKLFKLPYRGSNATAKKIPGTGMGLLIVKDFVERLGGSISFHSREGEGTTFELQLPLKQPQAMVPTK